MVAHVASTICGVFLGKYTSCCMFTWSHLPGSRLSFFFRWGTLVILFSSKSRSLQQTGPDEKSEKTEN